MANEIKFAYLVGRKLAFSAFQPDGTGRGIEQQPLSEIRPKGYYIGTPLTALVVGDVVLIYELETVTYEDAPVFVSDYEDVYCEGSRVYYEGEFVISMDDTVNCSVTWIGNPKGYGEYHSVIDADVDRTSIEEKIDQLIIDQGKVNNVYPESSAGEAVLGRTLRIEDFIGYFPRNRRRA